MRQQLQVLKRHAVLVLAALAALVATLVVTGCTTPYGLPKTPAPTSSQASMLYRLRMCETGGNYHMHVWAGNIEYAGAYGFNVHYWRAQGHRPDPQFASPALQDAVELSDIRLLGIRNSNPGCAKRLGL